VYEAPLTEAGLVAARAAGHQVTDDYNGARNEGFCMMQSTIRNGRRCSAAAAYLRPAMKRPNVTVETKAFADRVVLEGGRAVGIAYTKNGTAQQVRAEREVILSGGVINSPQLLMLSGIGEPDQLTEFGIKTEIELPSVGKNLQDHLSVGVEYWRKGKGPFVGYLRYDRLVLAMAQAFLFGKGPATEMSGPVMAFIKTRPELAVPDLQFLMRFIPSEAEPWFPGVRKEPRDAFMCRPVLLHPESRGEIRLRSADPRDKVRILQNFLDSEYDRKTLRDGLRLVREIATQKPLDAFRGEEIAPGPAVQSDDEIDAYVRETGWTAHHPLGSCKMGGDGDAGAVVDPELRVRGVEGLRVVDASVIPDMVGGNINAPVIMIAEKASDHIRGRTPLAPAEV
jgi:choline dehydrogenase/4-pyridoxate dehydrogenase